MQASSNFTGIKYLCVRSHENKDGCNEQRNFSVHDISDTSIASAVQKEKIEAQKTIGSLGMADLLGEKCWEYPIIPKVEINTADDDDEEDNEVDDMETEYFSDICTAENSATE